MCTVLYRGCACNASRYFSRTFKQLGMHITGLTLWSAGAALGTLLQPGIGSEAGAFIVHQIGMLTMASAIAAQS